VDDDKRNDIQILMVNVMKLHKFYTTQCTDVFEMSGGKKKSKKQSKKKSKKKSKKLMTMEW
jgi:hypothetical protein